MAIVKRKAPGCRWCVGVLRRIEEQRAYLVDRHEWLEEQAANGIQNLETEDFLLHLRGREAVLKTLDSGLDSKLLTKYPRNPGLCDWCQCVVFRCAEHYAEARDFVPPGDATLVQMHMYSRFYIGVTTAAGEIAFPPETDAGGSDVMIPAP